MNKQYRNNAKKDGSGPSPGPWLEKIAIWLKGQRGLTFVLVARDGLDDAIDAHGPDHAAAYMMVAGLSHESPKPHCVNNGEPVLNKAEEVHIRRCIKHLRSAGTEFILCWRWSEEDLPQVAYASEQPWRDVREELTDVLMFNAPVA